MGDFNCDDATARVEIKRYAVIDFFAVHDWRGGKMHEQVRQIPRRKVS